MFIKKEEDTKSQKKVLSIWHVDTFEGGVGSRRSFLFNVASKFEKKNNNVLIMVTNYTIEGIENALEKGNKPDMVSYGCGINLQGIKELNIKTQHSGGKIADKTFAVPWCKGGYVLISKDKNISENKILNNLVVSQGEYTQPLVALLYNGYMAQNVKVYSGQNAFAEFISGKANYFVGTQRDVVRLSYKNYNYGVYPLENYNDLYQYLAITAKDENVEICNEFCKYVLSQNIQRSLNNIKMFSDNYSIEYEDENYINIQKIRQNSTLSIFCDKQTIKQMQELSLKAILGDKDAYLKIKNIIF